MGVLAHAYPPLGGRKHGEFDQFLNKPTGNIHSTSGRLQGRAE